MCSLWSGPGCTCAYRWRIGDWEWWQERILSVKVRSFPSPGSTSYPTLCATACQPPCLRKCPCPPYHCHKYHWLFIRSMTHPIAVGQAHFHWTPLHVLTNPPKSLNLVRGSSPLLGRSPTGLPSCTILWPFFVIHLTLSLTLPYFFEPSPLLLQREYASQSSVYLEFASSSRLSYPRLIARRTEHPPTSI